MTPTTDASPILDALRASIATVIGPDDPEYGAARVVLYDEDARPAAIARPADAAEVARVVDVARETGAELAVRSGGHSGGGHGTSDGGIVLDLRRLTGLDLDVDARTAWAGTGLTAGEVGAALAEHGLVVGFGDTASVGIGGITSGGGIGYLVRKLGLTIDNVLAAEVVTADGQVRHVDADHEPDLFWAIRGGAGNVGVVTRFLYRLSELPGIVGGLLILPATADTVAGFPAGPDGVSPRSSGGTTRRTCSGGTRTSSPPDPRAGGVQAEPGRVLRPLRTVPSAVSTPPSGRDADEDAIAQIPRVADERSRG